MTLVTNSRLEDVLNTIPFNTRLYAYDISQGIHKVPSFPKQVCLSWLGDDKQITADILKSGATIVPQTEQLRPGDTLYLFIIPISRVLFIQIL